MEESKEQQQEEEKQEEEKPRRWYFRGVPCIFPERTCSYLTHPLSVEQRRRAKRPGTLSIDPDLHFGLTPESETDAVPCCEAQEQQQMPQQHLGTLCDDGLTFLKSSSYIPYVFPSPRPEYQPDRRSINEIGATKDEANAKSVSPNNLGMPSKRPKQDVVFKVLKPIPGTLSEFSATIIRYPFASGGTEPVVEKAENVNPATLFMVETTVAASGTKEDVGVPLAQMSEEGPLLKRCKSVGSNLS